MRIEPLPLTATWVPPLISTQRQVDEGDLAALLGLDLEGLQPRDAADVERAHGELGAGLADGLGGDDTDGGAALDHAAGGRVEAVGAGRCVHVHVRERREHLDAVDADRLDVLAEASSMRTPAFDDDLGGIAD
jgi:hypothetical protein